MPPDDRESDYRALLGRDVPADFDFSRIIEALDRHCVRFIVVGGMADVLHGSDQLTTDADILVSIEGENLDHLGAALRELGADRATDTEAFISEVEEFTTEAGLIDVFRIVKGIGDYEEVLPHTELDDFDGHDLRYLDLRTLIRAREATGRERDQLRVAHLYRLAAELGIEPRE